MYRCLELEGEMEVNIEKEIEIRKEVEEGNPPSSQRTPAA
jgi:hypothetical protein